MCIKTLKSKIVVAALASSLAFSNTNAGMAVTDAGLISIETASFGSQISHFAEVIAHQAKEAAQFIDEKTQWAKQLAHYAKEIQAYKDQLIATSGIKDAISAYQSLNDLYGSLKGAYERTEKLVEDPASAVKDAFGKEWDQYMKFDQCQGKSGEDAQNCYAGFASMVGDLGTQNKAKELYKEKNEKSVKELATKTKESQDIKESADINNAIALEMYQLMLHEADKRATERALADKARLADEAWRQQNRKEVLNAEMDLSIANRATSLIEAN